MFIHLSNPRLSFVYTQSIALNTLVVKHLIIFLSFSGKTLNSTPSSNVMRLYEILYSTFLLSTLTRADIEFIFPIAGSTAKGGEVLTALWKDSGYYPKVSELTNYTLSLCAGRASTTSTVSVDLLLSSIE